MRKLLLAFLLPFVLLISQQGAVSHEIGHIADQWTIPLGAVAQLDADALSLTVQPS